MRVSDTDTPQTRIPWAVGQSEIDFEVENLQLSAYSRVNKARGGQIHNLVYVWSVSLEHSPFLCKDDATGNSRPIFQSDIPLSILIKKDVCLIDRRGPLKEVICPDGSRVIPIDGPTHAALGSSSRVKRCLALLIIAFQLLVNLFLRVCTAMFPPLRSFIE